MAHKDFCEDHEAIKACAKGVITWPKFITIIISIIVIAIGVTTTVTNSIFSSVNKAEAKACEVEQASISRDKEISSEFKNSMEKYIIPMCNDVAVIKEQVKALKK